MPAGAAGDDANVFEFAELLLGDSHVAEIDFSGVLRNAAEKSVADGAGLLENLLLHVVLVAALFRHDGIPRDVMRFALDSVAVVIHDANTFFGEDCDIGINEEEHSSRVFKKGGNVAGDKIFAIAETDNRGRAAAGSDDFIGIAGGKKNERVNSTNLPERCANGFFERNFSSGALHILLDKMRDDFGIGFRNEFVTFALKLFLELEIVFNDAIVHDDDLSGAIAMRMRIFLGGTAVRSPASVSNTVSSFDRRFLNGLFEIAKFAGGATDFEFARGIDDGDTGRVVAAIFEFA